MKDLTRRTNAPIELTLEERLKASLARAVTPNASGAGWPSDSALLLDTSGSMNEELAPNQTKMSELRILARNFQGVRTFCFAVTCHEVDKANSVPWKGWGGTAMDVAFATLKAKGIKHVVLITDGAPDNADRAIEASRGLKIDAFYVGPDPAPPFLARLCAQTGGSYGKATLRARKELEGKVRALLPAPAPKGGIVL